MSKGDFDKDCLQRVLSQMDWKTERQQINEIFVETIDPYIELNKYVLFCTWQLRFNYSERSDLESYSVSRNALVSFFQQSISQR